MSDPSLEPYTAKSPPTLSASARQSLVQFLKDNTERAIAEWALAIRTIPAATMLDADELRDHMPALIERVISLVERSTGTAEIGDLPDQHAIVRLQEGFNLEQVAWEYTALRSTLLRLNDEGEHKLQPASIVLLNDAIDHAVVRAVTKYHRTRVRMLEALDRIAHEGLLAEPEALDALLHRLLRVITDSVESVDTAVIYLHEWGRLVLRAAEGLEREVEGRFSLAFDEGFAGAVAQSRRPLITHSAETDPRVRSPVLKTSGVKALYGVPLVYGDEVVGVAKMGSRTLRDFSAEDRQILMRAAERAAAFIAQRRAVDEREMLLHILGHDLRSPMNAIVLGASRARQAESLPSAIAPTLDRIVSAARRMDRLISDLTDYTQTRSTGRLLLRRETFDLRDALAEIVGELQGKSDREIQLHCAGSMSGEWDRGRVTRAIVNLVNNALAYGAPSTPITVRVEGDDASARVHVHNAGSPIPPELLPHVFEAFKRGSAGAGAGLGLYIVQEIVAAHGGHVEVESTAQTGTTFTVHLPRAG